MYSFLKAFLVLIKHLFFISKRISNQISIAVHISIFVPEFAHDFGKLPSFSYSLLLYGCVL